MKIIVFGATGMLGRYVFSYLTKHGYDVLPVTREDYDIIQTTQEKLDDFLRLINIEKNDVIVNCAGIIPQRGKHEIVDYIMINTYFPRQLAHFSQDVLWGVKVVQASTDCVFSGKKGHYVEDDIVDAKDIYGFTKAMGESNGATIIRTSIIGEEINNKVSFLEFIRKNEGGTIKGYTNQYWNGITCLEWAELLERVIENDVFWLGHRHIFSERRLSKYELACLIRKVYNINVEIIPIQADKYSDKTLSSNVSKGLGAIFTIRTLEWQIQHMKEYKL